MQTKQTKQTNTSQTTGWRKERKRKRKRKGYDANQAASAIDSHQQFMVLKKRW